MLARHSKNQALARQESDVIKTGANAPDFSLVDQFNRKISSSQFRGKKHVLLLFYPLDFTPT